MKNLQSVLRRLLGVMGITEVEAAAMHAYSDARADIERAMTELHAQERRLKATEDRINARFRELEKAEIEMHRVAAGISVTIYDLVQAVQIEHGAVQLTADGKAILEGD